MKGADAFVAFLSLLSCAGAGSAAASSSSSSSSPAPHVALVAPPVAEHVAPLKALAAELIDRGLRVTLAVPVPLGGKGGTGAAAGEGGGAGEPPPQQQQQQQQQRGGRQRQQKKQPPSKEQQHHQSSEAEEQQEQEAQLLRGRGWVDDVPGLAFVAAGRYNGSVTLLLTGNDDGTIRLWNPDSGSTITLEGHSNTVCCLAAG